MKIDFKQLAKAEKQCANNGNISLHTLQLMIDQVLTSSITDTMGLEYSKPIAIAMTTLKELGILKDDNDTPKVQQLNS